VFFQTEGYNPYFVDSSYIAHSLRKNLPDYMKERPVDSVYFYGAGCASGMDDIISNAIGEIFTTANIFIEMDLLAAARGLLGDKPGFAAILGTGCNTCLYDGNKVIKNIDSLGFILGDEGSGGAIGKRLLSDFIRENMPLAISSLFRKTYNLSADDIIHRIYTQPMANRFCSGFCTFIKEHIDDPYMYNLVRNCFSDFFTNLVSKYPDYKKYQFNSIGSIGYHFRDIMQEVSDEFEMSTGIILESPMPGLVEYHHQQQKKMQLDIER
jgi:N-acetylglucosamine kinase-like BadF-type ATPase